MASTVGGPGRGRQGVFPGWFREEVPLPAFGEDYLQESLASLERAAS
ncbi:Uncharacterised protein [Kytococcus sedentarius]|nr:Uncharacterised protein [Kytococcus sedentarius]